MKTVSAIVLMIVLITPGRVWADGYLFSHTTNDPTNVALATAQRAVLWQRAGTWEIHIQPRFDRAAGTFAWVVPFPVRPTVAPSSADFFDQLEILTSPIFFSYCTEGGESSGCGYGGDEGEGEDAVLDEQSIHTDVRIWEQGAVGQLDYVVLSTFEGQSLIAWLGQEGFVIPQTAIGLLEGMDAKGTFYFVARIPPQIDPQKPLAPVRFVLPDMVAPTFPLEMTAIGVPAGAKLDLTLWVIGSLMPSSHPFGTLSTPPQNSVDFHTEVDKFFTVNSDDTLIGFVGPEWGQLGDPVPGGYCVATDDIGQVCIDYATEQVPAPQAWGPELVEIDAAHAVVVRYEGRLPAAALDRDLAFLIADTATDLPAASNVIAFYTGDCGASEDGNCAIGPHRGTRVNAGLILVGLLLTAILLRRRFIA